MITPCARTLHWNWSLTNDCPTLGLRRTPGLDLFPSCQNSAWACLMKSLFMWCIADCPFWRAQASVAIAIDIEVGPRGRGGSQFPFLQMRGLFCAKTALDLWQGEKRLLTLSDRDVQEFGRSTAAREMQVNRSIHSAESLSCQRIYCWNILLRCTVLKHSMLLRPSAPARIEINSYVALEKTSRVRKRGTTGPDIKELYGQTRCTLSWECRTAAKNNVITRSGCALYNNRRIRSGWYKSQTVLSLQPLLTNDFCTTDLV
jgi:hypothetical protein